MSLVPSIYQSEIIIDQLILPQSSYYNIGFYWKIKGCIDYERLCRCIQSAVLRHQSLCLLIRQVDEGQFEFETTDQPVRYFKNELDEPFSQSHWDNWLSSIESMPFSLLNSPLIENHSLSYRDKTHCVLMKFHHVLVDARSIQLLENDIVSLYNQTDCGQASAYQSSVMNLLEYGQQLEVYQQSKRYRTASAYWREYAQNLPKAEAGRVHKVMSPNQRHTLFIPESDYRSVQAWCTSVGVSMPIYLCAIEAYLNRYFFGKTQTAIALPLLNRRLSQKKQVGFFANIVLVSIECALETEFYELLKNIKNQTNQAYRHQQYPFAEIVRAKNQLTSSASIFDVKISYEVYEAAPGFIGTETKRATLANHQQDHPLSISVREIAQDQCYEINFDCALELFDSPIDMSVYLDVFKHCFEHLYKRSESSYWAFNKLPPQYRQKLAQINDTKTPLPDLTLVDVFRFAADRYANTPALLTANRTLNYQQVDQVSSQIASGLIERGVEHQDRVGIHLERSEYLLLAILGILKAGAIYVPMEPSQPLERLRLISEGAQTKYVVVGESDDQGFTNGLALEALLNGAVSEGLAQRYPRASDSAYILFTSGSTGQPKGVEIRHQSIVNRIQWQQSAYPIAAGDCLIQKTPYGFDVSVWELFWWFWVGAKLFVPSPGAEKRPDLLIDIMASQGISAIHFVPSMLNAFVEYWQENPDQTRSLTSLRYVICSGEALTGDHVRGFYQTLHQVAPQSELVNLYGPTEACVDVSAWRCHKVDQARVSVPIGRPIANTELWVLNSDRAILPPGVQGELYIGGLQLAKGYWQQPELSRQQFCEVAALGKRLYATGDIASYDEQWVLQYWGRSDHQVKIRGNRIELGEVEAVARSFHAVVACCVTLWASPDGDALCCYVQAAAPIDLSELKLFMSQRLPAYMVPEVYQLIDIMPLNANGKLDRKALPRPDTVQRANSALQPKTDFEKDWLSLIGTLFGIKPRSLNQHFLEMGLDSIKLIKLQSAAKKQGYSLSLSDLYHFPSISALSTLWTNRDDSARIADEPVMPFGLVGAEAELDRAVLDDAFPATDLQIGMIFHSMKHPGAGLYHDVFHYQLTLDWQESRFLKALTELIQRHASLRTAFDMSAPDRPLALVHKTIPVALSVEDLSGADEAEIDQIIQQYIEQQRARVFAWDQPTLFSYKVYVRQGSISLVFSFHHALLDGWSAAILMRDLLNQYRQVSNSAITPYDQLPCSCADYVLQELRATDSDHQQVFWSDYLQQATDTTLPHWAAYYPASHQNVFTVKMPDQLNAMVQQFVTRQAVSEKHLFMALHVLMLGRFTGQSEVLFGLVSNGRPELSGADQLTGLFLNTLPVLATVRKNGLMDLVHHLMAQERKLLPYRRYPLSRLIEVAPAFNSVFNYVDFHILGDVFAESDVRLLNWQAIESTNFDMLVTYGKHPVSGGFILNFNINPQTIAAEQVQYFSEQLFNLLEEILNLESQSLPSLNHQLVSAAPNTLASTYSAHTVAELLQQSFQAHPRARALQMGDQSVSYAELDKQSRQLGNALLEKTSAWPLRAVVALPRSIELIVTAVSCARLGVQCIPLDLSQPVERINYLLSEVQPDLIIASEGEECPALAPFASISFFYHELLNCPGQNQFDNQAAKVAADSPLYLLYTSGSTGVPKGVDMPQGPLANLVNWQRQFDQSLQEYGRQTLQYAPATFDVFFQELFTTLANGGTLHLISEVLRYDLAALLNYLQAEAISRIYLPYAALQHLADVACHLDRYPAGLKHIIVAGEQLKITPEIRAFMRCLSHSVLDNHYGPTEAHVVSAYRLSGHPDHWPDLPPIGKPIANTALHILDKELCLLPDGVEGNLWIEGACLANGYWNQPQLTEQRFIELGRGSEVRRLYNTGDRALRLADGNIAYLGRSDSQLKIRGYRIEPAEIEQAILGYNATHDGPMIRDAAVVAQQHEPNQPMLCAFVETDDAAIVPSLKAHLKNCLPAYMIPGSIDCIPRLPLGASGKVDRLALKQHSNQTDVQHSVVKPETHTQLIMLDLWSGVLKRDIPSIDDDFFELGGHSLLAVQLSAKLEKRFDRPVPLSWLIQLPSIRLLSQRIDQSPDQQQTQDCLIPLNKAPEHSPLIYLVHPIGGNVLCYRNLVSALGNSVQAYGIQAPGVDGQHQTINNLVDLSRFYAEQIQAQSAQRQVHLAGWSFGGFVAYQLQIELVTMGIQVQSLSILDSIVIRNQHPIRVSKQQLLQWFAWELLSGDFSEIPAMRLLDFQRKTEAEVFSEIHDLAVSQGVFDADLPQSRIEHLYQVFVANWQALLDYRIPVTQGIVHLFCAEQALPEVLFDPHSAVDSAHDDEFRGWRGFNNSIKRHAINADHLTLMQQPHVDLIAQRMLEIIFVNQADKKQEVVF